MPLVAAWRWREDIAHDDEDREMFVATLAEACLKTGWEVLAWVLMGNHYHWLVRTPGAQIRAILLRFHVA